MSGNAHAPSLLPYRARPDDPALDYRMTDASHAEHFAETHGLDVRFDSRRRIYLTYHAPLWRPDRDGEIVRLAIAFARTRQSASLQIVDPKVRARVVEHFIRAESKAAIDRLVALAKSQPPIADLQAWDVDPWLLGAPNGIIDLRTGTLREGDPADRITMAVRIPFDPTATAPRWRRFIAEIFSGDADLATFVQRYLGYALTGCTHEQLLVLFYGKGANGKTVTLKTTGYVLGDYTYNLPFSVLEMHQRSAIPNDLAALEGKRFVTASETNDKTRLNEARIKALTGADPITARFLHAEFFTFQPVAKFILATNHKPVVKDDSYGFWRRLRLVPFTSVFKDADRDPNLEQYFRDEEAPGILAWLVEGCLDWQAHGLGEAAAVAEATTAYQEASDPLAEFFSECCALDAEAETKAGVVADLYRKWADRQGLGKLDRLNGRDLGLALTERFPKSKRKDGLIYRGFRLVTGQLWV